MTAELYTHRDADGDELQIQSTPSAGNTMAVLLTVVTGHSSGSVGAAAEDAPTVATEILRAAGWKQPIVLEGLDLNPADRTVTAFGALQLHGQTIVLRTLCDNCGTFSPKEASPAGARDIAGHLAVMSEYAMREPDPAAVAELVAAMEEISRGVSGDYAATVGQERLAVELLRRFNLTERAQ
ncbi:hypothetical protein GCM10022252_75360 [Streptosporangium oxazolinicum]|uniref:Uncharacterized protein n=1 Tax=Streptosporangium oxazolinicum TaxID=909287 RepID=A0ABP8BKN6_9ACTN